MERDFRTERSRFETSGGRLCPATDRVQDTREVSRSRVVMNRTDLRYALGTLVAPNGKTGFEY